MNKKQKKMLIRIIIAAVLIVVFSLLPAEGYLRFVLFMIPYLVIGYDILKKAFKGILNKQVFDENFLMAVATVGAILLGDYSEGVAVMLFYQIGELFQSYAVGKSRRNISELMDIRPDYANIEKDGTLEQVDPDEVEIGYKHGGRLDTGIDALEWAKKVEELGAGEILLTSMDCDGTKAGYDIELTRAVADAVSIPVIASGGAGTLEHFYDALTEGGADAALAASLFHYKELEIREVKDYLAEKGISVRR